VASKLGATAEFLCKLIDQDIGKHKAAKEYEDRLTEIAIQWVSQVKFCRKRLT
jgi:hypothetical protein